METKSTIFLFFIFFRYTKQGSCLCVGNGDLDLNSWLDADRGDLLYNLAGRVKINQALVNTHLEPATNTRHMTMLKKNTIFQAKTLYFSYHMLIMVIYFDYNH